MLTVVFDNPDESRRLVAARYLLYHTLGILDNQVNYSDAVYLHKFLADISADKLRATDSALPPSYQKITESSYQKLLSKSRACRKLDKCLVGADSEEVGIAAESRAESRRHSLIYDMSGGTSGIEGVTGSVGEVAGSVGEVAGADIDVINGVLNGTIVDEKKLLNIYGGDILMSQVARYVESGRVFTSPYFFNFVNINIHINTDVGLSAGANSKKAISRIVLAIYIFVRIHCYSATLVCGDSRVSEAIQAEIKGLKKRGYVIKNNKHIANKYVLRLDPHP